MIEPRIHVGLDDCAVDRKKVKARKDAVVERSNKGVENWLRNMTNCTVYEGHGRLESARTVRVGADVLTADQIFLNVGARPFVPEGFAGVDYLTNTSIMDVDFLPEHLIVIGGSYIGLEFGQMYRRFGSEVTVLQEDLICGVGRVNLYRLNLLWDAYLPS